MTRRVTHATFKRSCRTCNWTGTFDTAGRANYAKRRHSCERWLDKKARTERGRARMVAVDRTPKPCLHKVADHQHGTYACYTLDACRCPPCCAAVSAYETDRVRRHAYGRWDNYVDAEPTRQHVRRLLAAGMGLKRVGTASGVSHGVLWRLLYGKTRPDGTRVPSKRVSKHTERRILAVELDLADGARVPNTDTARRLQALVANGWSMSKLGLFLGVTGGNFNPIVTGTRPEVTVATAKAVHKLYAELAEKAPPEDEWRDKIAASRARNLANQRGWAKPLRINGRLLLGTPLPLPELDQDDAIDTAVHIDVVEQILAGDYGARCTPAEKTEAARRWAATGRPLNDLERFTGWRISRYFKLTDREERSA